MRISILDVMQLQEVVSMRNLKLILTIGTVSIWHSLFCQVTTEPRVPSPEGEIKIIYDATKGTSGLAGADKVYMHSGVIIDSENGVSWQNVVGNWGVDDGIGEMTQVEGESDLWEITINPREYYSVTSGPIYRIGMVFRNASGNLEGKSDANGDIFVNLVQGGYGIVLFSPEASSFLVSENDVINIDVAASETSDFTLSIGGTIVQSSNGSDLIYEHTVTETSGTVQVAISATNGTDNDEASFEYIIRENPSELSIPMGIKRGINYDDSDNTKVTLCLEAPFKNSVYVVGDFNDWNINSEYQMNKDGELFWLEINGLTPNQEYRFQYMVDETIFVADPYSDKISDPDDTYISSSIYPDLIEYPSEAYRDRWYYQRASVIETNRSTYNWEIIDFTPPAKEELVVYELLIRDFFGAGQRTYKNVTDTLPYLADLGINAIELMPVTEFNGNESWGYNPTFMLAPDKSYGTREDLKELIDEAHKLGIAVILDMVMNHQDIPGTMAAMYFDNGITPDNPWINTQARHPFNVFFDFNHESSYTQNYLDSVNLYWVEEYKFDGFRYDLSKGFTQVNSGDDVGAWSSYDQSRINLLKRMSDVVWAYNPETYVILEHFADNSEEKELAEYGMMLWGNMNHSYSQLAMGYSSESNISGVEADNRGWDKNHLVGYMESHDEERMMYRCLEFGNENSSYSTKDFETALERVKAASAFFYTIPGPKMLWQFGELGFDYSINRCTDGSIDEDCRLAIKPTRWEYLENDGNQDLFEVTKALINLKTDHDLFDHGDARFFNGSNLSRYVWVTQNELENPSDPSEMNAVVIGNFDISRKNLDVNFPHDGKWYHYFDQGDSVEVAGTTTLTLQAGEFRVYTDVKLDPTLPELMTNLKPLAPTDLILSDTEEGVELSWNSTSEINLGTRVYRSADNTSYELIAELGKVGQYLDESVRQGNSYSYYIADYNEVGERASDISTITANNVVLNVIEASEILIYPNPIKDQLRIDSQSQFEKIIIFNLGGKSVLETGFQNQIDLSRVEAGTYLLRLEGSEIKTFKIIKE